MSFLKEIIKFFTTDLLNTFIGDIRTQFQEFMDDTQKRIDAMLSKFVKNATLLLLLLLGFIFVLSGFAKYLNETVPALHNGLGTILVGAIIISFSLFARIMK